MSRRAPVAAALHHLIITGDQGRPIPASQAAQLSSQASRLPAGIQRLAR